MKPTATYRVQLNKEFNFDSLKTTLPYLAKLGVSHVYASPIMQARRGSKHGYDTTDHSRISEELGGQEAFETLLEEAHRLGLGWIQDIVPNHIAYTPESTIMSDVMSYGSSSAYSDFLDVDWNHPSQRLRRRVLAPILSEGLGEAVREGKLSLAWQDGFKVKYGEMEFPVKIGSYKDILPKTYQALLSSTKNEQELYQDLQHLYISDKKVKDIVEREIEWTNRDPVLIEELLSQQIYALENWKTAYNIINYRRFFDILDLICLRMEDENVFEATHRLVRRHCSKGNLDGLRVDHIDGLREPKEYLQRLRKICPEAYVIVEKILLDDEELPATWDVQGTTGYDFINQVNGLFIATQNESKLDEVYRKFTCKKETLDEVLCKCKKTVIKTLFRGDAENLARILLQAMEKTKRQKISRKAAYGVVIELLSALPVYRTYFSSEVTSNESRRRLKVAFEVAKQRNRDLEEELTAVADLCKKNPLPEDILAWILRLQQYSGSVMAKGYEDTAFYRFNRLISLNEVGGNPARFGCSTESFNDLQISRQTKFPLSLNASSTHDTKRGEDCRARLNVLSEITAEFDRQIACWSRLNAEKKEKVNGKLAPSKNEEYYFYQTLIGSFPFEAEERLDFAERLKSHMVKAVREAKVNSSWLRPNLQYEEALTSFVSQLLEDSDGNAFWRDFMAFQKRVAFYGFFNSLSQTLLKMACPGMPDFYQGAELWNLSMVDPDNRRPVNYIKRGVMLDEVERLDPAKARSLLDDFSNAKAKLYLINRALKLRRRRREVFWEGEYVPLNVKGAFGDDVVAFCRKKAEEYVMVVAPRFVATVTGGVERLPLGEVWEDTTVCFPNDSQKSWTDVLSGNIFLPEMNRNRGLRVADLLSVFPVALLVSSEVSL